MKLAEILENIESAHDDLTIYARSPWLKDSDAALAEQESEEERLLKSEGYEYFLEVFIAKEFASDWKKESFPPEKLCDRLIQYAIHDA